MTKLRIDSWAAGLTDEQSWRLYYKGQTMRWYDAAQWAAKEYGVEPPRRNAWYDWQARMRGEESAHRLEQVATANAEAAALAKRETRDEDFIAAAKTLAANLALQPGGGGAKEAVRLVRMAMDLADRRLKAEALKLKGRAQGAREKALELEREKFEAAERRENAARRTLGDRKMTQEEKLKELDRLFGK